MLTDEWRAIFLPRDGLLTCRARTWNTCMALMTANALERVLRCSLHLRPLPIGLASSRHLAFSDCMSMNVPLRLYPS